MANPQNKAAPHYLRTLFDVGAVAGWTDGELLDRFVARDGVASELAFSVLVERHGPMVLRVCRRVLADPHDAQDAFQSTFLILARRAGAIRRRESVGSWLHGVALRVASVARSAAARRRAHERGAAEIVAGHSSSPSDQADLGPVLHEELQRLPERYRAPLVLCYLEGLTHEQAAQQLRWPVGTVRSRLARGRERLRGGLTRRGLAPSVGALGLLAVESALADLPADLVVATAQAAVHFAQGGAAGMISAAAALAKGALRGMFLAQLRRIAGGVFLCGVVAAGVGVATRPGAADDHPAVPAPPLKKPPARPIDRVLDAAARAVETADDPASRAYTLVEIAKAQARAGAREGARETARRASAAARALEPREQSPALLSVAWVRFDLGDPGGAREDLQNAADATTAIGDDIGQLHAWELIAVALDNLGDPEAALATIRTMRAVAFKLKGQGERISGWGALVTAQAYVGDYEGAFFTVDAVEGDDYLKGHLLGQIASTAASPAIWYHQPRKTFSPEGRAQRLGVVRRAVKAVEPLASAKEKPYVDLSLALAHLGAFDEALGLARHFAKAPALHAPALDPANLPYLLGMIGGAQGKAGQREEASRTFREALNSVARDAKSATSLGHIAFGQAMAGDFAAALTTVEAIDPKPHLGLLIEVAEMAEQDGDLAAARAVYHRALHQSGWDKPPRPEPDPDAERAPVDADGKRIPRDKIDRGGPRSAKDLQQIATILARLGEIQAAMEALKAITSVVNRGWAARSIAEARARAGDAEGALTWALTLEPQSVRVLALRGLAMGALPR